MRSALVSRVLAVSAAALLAAALTACVPESVESSVDAPACAAGEPLAQELEGGSTWTLCWSVDPKQGLVLRDVRYAPPEAEPILIAQEIALAQLEVPYDTGERTTYDLTEAGFGSTKILTLTETECLGERIATEVPNLGDGTFGQTPTREVLCAEIADGGIAYRSGDGGDLQVARRSDWRLSTISKVGWYEYISQYTFGSDGVIRTQLGATGDISPFDFAGSAHGSPVGEGNSAYAVSHSHNAVWRVHWALDDPGRLAVEQYDAEDTGENGAASPVVEGTYTSIGEPAMADWTDRRWWRVLAPDVPNADGHPISYQIELERTDSFAFTSEDGVGYDVAFTNADDCQVFAAVNREPCGDGVPDYVAGAQGEPLGDVVSWVAVGFHHVVRDEDQSPMDVHWQGFTLLPRDLTAQRTGVPGERRELNGVPDNEWTQEYERAYG